MKRKEERIGKRKKGKQKRKEEDAEKRRKARKRKERGTGAHNGWCRGCCVRQTRDLDCCYVWEYTVCFCISLHNFPEGMAVFLGSLKGLRVGISLACAIALHNIPEGIAVALPVYYATESKWQAFKYATLSGFAEPLGVILVAFLFPSSLSAETLEGLLGAVGGVMAFLTLHEMLPLAFEYAGHRKAVVAVFIGMAVMSASLQLLQMTIPEDIVI